MSKNDPLAKILKLEELLSEQDHELDTYREFFDASLAMNIAAASLPAAARVQRALREVEVVRIKKGIRGSEQPALKALNNISVDK